MRRLRRAAKRSEFRSVREFEYLTKRMEFTPRAQALRRTFGLVTTTTSKKIRHIALSAIKDHNAIKGTNMYLVSILEARVMEESIGLLYWFALCVKPVKTTKERAEWFPPTEIIEKMVWVGESKESIVCYKPRLNYLIDSDVDFQFDFDFKQPFPQRPSSTKTKKLAQFALEEFNTSVGQSYCFKLKDSENVKITLAKWGSRIYPKGAAGYSVFNVYLFDLNKLVENKHIPINLMVVTKTWLQTLDDKKADSFLDNLSLPRDLPVIERRTLTEVISSYPILEVSLTGPTVETKAWFAVEDELFKRNRQLEFVRVVRGSITTCAGKVFNLTIEAWDDGVLKKFDTHVWERKWRGTCFTYPFEETTTSSEILVGIF
ncbi:hypothetical protein FRX31_014496 [Thalictrum thalictroides]|uniref:Cysteine proteinase inhibitor n=1 Tax=Thalictrum thalictroides TaxID=46969 RepID=A0A7J6WH05_THATH|nr:hypothetical protein FRX31_014496 [Thalictrum thalictroides]